MAYYFKLEGNALAAYNKMVHVLIDKAMRELKLPREEVVVRPLRPEDVGLTTPVWTFNVASANAWNIMINEKIINDNRFVGINGVLYGESGTGAVTQLEITRQGEIKRYWQVQDVNFLEDAAVFFDDPVTVDQNTTITVKGYATAIEADLRLSFLGAVAEKRGLLIS